MVRPREFDEAAVLGAAMHAFRARGFRDLSIRDLGDATGVTVGSLYNAYGDKDGVFRAALRFYLEAVVGERFRQFCHPGATLHDFEQLFLSLFEAPQNDGNGCLLINSAVEFGGAATHAADDLVREGLALTERVFRETLARHLPAEAVEVEAARLFLLYQGVLVSSRASRSGSAHRVAIQEEFTRLRGLATAGR